MKYQLIETSDVLRVGMDDSLLNDGYEEKIAEGELLDGRKWVAQLRAVGDIRGVLHDRNSGEDIDIHNNNISIFFENNEQLAKAIENDDLELENNNWFDLEFIVDGKFIEMSDQDVAFSVNEGLALFDKLIEDPSFLAYLDCEEAGTRKRLETLVDWVFDNLSIESKNDIPRMFKVGTEEAVAFKKMIMERL